MFCPECGEKNKKESNFCTKCGAALNGTKKGKKVYPATNSGGVRRILKNDAKMKIKGSMIGAAALYFLICMIIGAAFENSVNINDVKFNAIGFIGSIITTIIGVIFGYGLISVCFKALRGKEVTLGEVFTEPFNHLKEIGYILLLIFICFLIGIVVGFLAVVPIIGFLVFIAFVVALVYFAPALTTFEMILADQENKSDLNFTDTFKKALDITEGHRVEYYAVIFSFIGWFLLIVPTIGIILIWLVPYVQLTLTNLYRKWINEESFETNLTGISDKAIIGLSLGGFGFLLIIMITIVFVLAPMIISLIGNISNYGSDIINRFGNSGIQDNYDFYFDMFDDFNRMNIYLK